MIFKPVGVDIQPEVTLTEWQIVEVDGNFDGMGKTYHFLGVIDTGRISSPIKEFDKEKMIGITRSGRVYKLKGEPAMKLDALYVLSVWAGNNEYTFVTDKFITQDFINVETDLSGSE